MSRRPMQASVTDTTNYSSDSRAEDTPEESDTTMKKSKTTAAETKAEDSPSALIDARIAATADWRGETLARVRKLIKAADPDVVRR